MLVKHLVILKITTDDLESAPPPDWNWVDLLDIAGNEDVEVVDIEELPNSERQI